jgi:hypothetical protein
MVRAGNYTEAVACVGSSSINVKLSVGDTTSSHTADCHLSPKPFELHVVTVRPGRVTIQIGVLGRGTVAVSYYLVSNHRDYVGH